MLEYNIKLVWLNEEVIPDTAIQAMNQCEYKSFDVSYIRSNYKQLLKQDDYLQNLFEDAF
jgi:HKD family nuclease